ncbi:radical SAM superfamily enzyme YgiQ (UPF0313 family) [Desulfitispora alkaliphila]|uniref:B12-binding domain-containing radical SAM protein n=1 Tax=Desulfitispora alkaliphila TaxID=622674 RepID=UPI003D1F3C59
MKTLLVALNSSFIHSSLAVRYLSSYCKSEFEIEILEATVNAHQEDLLGKIYLQKADLVAFSCYIWNIELVLKIAQDLKKVAPATKILLGGPEVSFDGEETLAQHEYIDYIITGEGEKSFYTLLHALKKGENYHRLMQVGGLVWRNKGRILSNPVGEALELSSLSAPYYGDLKYLENKIVYFEASRGCPFNCSYCLSSATTGVRFFSMEKVKEQLGLLIAARVKQVKFVDRTFNANKEFAMEVWRFLVDNAEGDINFHFEISADLLDQESIEFLKGIPKGLFQFEIGVQSTNKDTLGEINRGVKFDKLTESVKRLREQRNIHLHLDLIAGLPEENYESFAQSFNDVIALKPDMLQQGFLKMLKGSAIRENAKEYSYKFKQYPPYEVLSNRDMSYEELLNLHRIEEVLVKYYNSRLFEYSLEHLMFYREYWDSPFEFFQGLAQYWLDKGHFDRGIKQGNLYEILLAYCEANNIKDMGFKELLKLDFLLSQRVKQLPHWCEQISLVGLKEKINKIKKEHQLLASQDVQFQVFSSEIVPILTKKDRKGKWVIVKLDYREKVISGKASWEIIEYL